MISRPSLVARAGRLAAHAPSCPRSIQRRFLASAVSTVPYEKSDAAGIKVAARDTHGPTTKLAIVAKAGTRYEPLPGLTVGLEEFAFKNTASRSALRITRESELLGGQLNATHTREALLVSAKFLSSDLPYFLELLAEVISQTRYTTHELHDDVERSINLKHGAYVSKAANVALDTAHATAFHTGLGAPLYPNAHHAIGKYTNEHTVADFAAAAFQKQNIAIVADGASSATLGKWAGEFFEELAFPAADKLALKQTKTTYRGGEQRVSHAHGNAITIAFPGASYDAPKPELAVLAALLGGQSSIKWATGSSLLAKATASTGATVSTVHIPYTDAGLFTISISGPASAVREAAQHPAKVLKSIAEGSIGKEDLNKAIAKARFDALDASLLRDTTVTLAGTGLVHSGKVLEAADFINGVESVTPEKIKAAAKAFLDARATVAVVGDLFALPYAEEIGFKV
jgi:ubiquinol-cytochrome c reductase core subunit 2